MLDSRIRSGESLGDDDDVNGGIAFDVFFDGDVGDGCGVCDVGDVDDGDGDGGGGDDGDGGGDDFHSSCDLSFGDGGDGACDKENKNGAWRSGCGICGFLWC